VASIGKYWNSDKTPKNKDSEEAMLLVKKTIEIIRYLHPKFWFIENPRGMLRTLPFMQNFDRKTVTYCRYGDGRMKPTDIWTNAIAWNPKAMCKNGDKCHVSAPRGSRTGTQGLDDDTERGRIPQQLCDEILDFCEYHLTTPTA
jgi:hypothetical protein